MTQPGWKGEVGANLQIATPVTLQLLLKKNWQQFRTQSNFSKCLFILLPVHSLLSVLFP